MACPGHYEWIGGLEVKEVYMIIRPFHFQVGIGHMGARIPLQIRQEFSWSCLGQVSLVMPLQYSC